MLSKIFPLNPNSKKRKRVTVSELFQRNKANISSHKPYPNYAELATSGYSAPPILLLTCSDLRCVPEEFFHLKPGEVVIIRSIGGRVEPQLPGILGVDWMFNFKEFVLIHHNDCGATHWNTEGLRALVRERAPGDRKVDSLEFGDIQNVEESARHDLKLFKESPYIRMELRQNAHAFVYDGKTGKLNPVTLLGEDRSVL